ncbi:MAG TPA: hypothetical protein VJM08_06190 [Anaerolineales bacterium]|nr:hypothetical protein [Anaerolineales bacterium]
MAISLSGLNRSPWFHFLGGAILWSAHFLISYGWVEFACRANLLVLDSTVLGVTVLSWSVLLLTLVATLAALYVGWSAYQSWRQLRSKEEAREIDNWSVEAHRFMALSGIFLSALFSLVILLTGLPALVLGPCT